MSRHHTSRRHHDNHVDELWLRLKRSGKWTPSRKSLRQYAWLQSARTKLAKLHLLNHSNDPEGLALHGWLVRGQTAALAFREYGKNKGDDFRSRRRYRREGRNRRCR